MGSPKSPGGETWGGSSAILTFRVERRLVEALDAHAAHAGLSRSQYLRFMIAQAVHGGAPLLADDAARAAMDNGIREGFGLVMEAFASAMREAQREVQQRFDAERPLHR